MLTITQSEQPTFPKETYTVVSEDEASTQLEQNFKDYNESTIRY